MKITSIFFATLFTFTSIFSGEVFAETTTVNPLKITSSNTTFQVGMYASLKNEVVVLLKKQDNKVVFMKIKDKNGETVFSENIQERGSVIKRYDVSTFVAGSYTVSLTREGEAFEQEITIQ